MTDPIRDIRHYSPKLTISQLIKFFEKKEMNLSRGMVQNYIRDGILPPPANKRFYTHKHIAALTLICKLKTVFSIPAIQKVLVPIMDDEGIPLETYFYLINKISVMLDGLINAESQAHDILLQMLLAAGIKERLKI